MIILHIAPITFNESSGLTRVIPKIVEEQNKLEGVNSALLNISNVKKKNNYSFKYFDHTYTNHFKLYELDFPYNKPDIVVLHSVYEVKYFNIAKQLIKHNIPYVLFPHGAMTFEAQNKNRVKKIVANISFFNYVVKNADKIQYLTSGEAKNSEKWKKDYFIAGNGIEVPEEFNKRNLVLNKNSINFNFLGRLDIRHKGIDYLLEACKISRNLLISNGIKINLFGPDQGGSVKFIKKFIKDYQLESIVHLRGPVYKKEKKEMFLNTDIFILLSRHEGLPTSVLEALSYGIPCIVTPGTNMDEIIDKNKCGWKVTANSNDIASLFSYIVTNIKYNEFSTMKLNARKFIEEHYSWNSISQIVVDEYRNILS